MASSTVPSACCPASALSLGYTLGYLSLIVLIPLAAVFFKAGSLGFDHFWAVPPPRRGCWPPIACPLAPR
jgi:sulfate transport system permease protein